MENFIFYAVLFIEIKEDIVVLDYFFFLNLFFIKSFETWLRVVNLWNYAFLS